MGEIRPQVGSQLLSLPFNLPVLAAVLPLPSVWSRFGFGRRWRIRPGGAPGGGLGAVQAAEGHCAVHVEEIGGEHDRSLGVQELPPRRVSAPLWRGRDPQRLEDPADRGRTDPVGLDYSIWRWAACRVGIISE